MRTRNFSSGLTGLLLVLATPLAAAPSSDRTVQESCVPPATWMVPGKAQRSHAAVIADLATRPVVLLGETHDSAEDHRWQVDTIAALHALRPELVLGFEAFPGKTQPVLDRWVAGLLDEKTFLKDSRWAEVWSFEPALYMPLFHFARMHKVPMVALNVERTLVARVRKEGWAAVPAADRQGVGDPAPPSPAYQDRLRALFVDHRDRMNDHAESADLGSARFVEAQLTWDRAMAEALARAHDRAGRPLVVGIVGRGHVEYGHGIVHQLADLGVTGAMGLVTWEPGRPCEDLLLDGTAVADVVFGTAPPPDAIETERPRLGVMLEEKDGVVQFAAVMPDSIAAATGLKKNDQVIEAAGVPVTRSRDFVAIIHRQAPGTWLPITIRRDGKTLGLVAKFPAAAP